MQQLLLTILLAQPAFWVYQNVRGGRKRPIKPKRRRLGKETGRYLSGIG